MTLFALCMACCVLYSAGSGVKSACCFVWIEKKMFVCVHGGISCRYDLMFAFAMFMSL